MKNKRVLITGVAGMIGSHILDEMIENNMVIGVDDLSFGDMDNIKHNLEHENFKFVQADIKRPLPDLYKGIDVVFHMAAVKKVPGVKLLDTMFSIGKGTEQVLESALACGCKVIVASTTDVYGRAETPYGEEDSLLLGPSTIDRQAYAVAKLYGEHLAFAYLRDHSLPTVVLRFCGVYSYRSKIIGGGHIPIFVDAVLKNKEVPIWGDGSQTRSISYVDNVVHGILLAAENEDAVGEIINIGGEDELSISETLHLIHMLADTGNPLKVKYIPMERLFGLEHKEIERMKPDLRRSQELLGWSPKVSLIEGLKRTIDNWRLDASTV